MDETREEGQQVSPTAAWKKIEERLDKIDKIRAEIHEFAEKIEERCREFLYNRGDDPKQVLRTISSLAAEIRRRT